MISKRSLFVILAYIGLMIASTTAEARHHHRHRHHHHHHHYSYGGGTIVGHNTSVGCPTYAACGCVASMRVFGRAIRNLFLAANWGQFPSANPAPGMAAWRYGHVLVLDHQDSDGKWIVYDGNSGGHMIRLHKRSLAGFRIVNPHGGSRKFT